MKAISLAIALLVSGLVSARIVVPSDGRTPQDQSYPGTLRISVDATDLDRRIFRVRETVPASAGALTLLYPQWLPGTHSPSGPIDKLAGLVMSANGRTLAWKRDPLNVYAFRVEVPQGASAVEVEFQYLTAQDTRQGRVVMTPEILNLQWNAVTLYPAGFPANRIKAEASVTLPTGWQLGTALEVAAREGDRVSFKPIDYDDLVDSPIFAGKHFKRVDLDPGAKTPVFLSMFTDDPKLLEFKPEQIQAHQNLVRQMHKLYGAHHYDRYEFLLSVSEKLSGIGLEHHRSSENGVGTGYFLEWDKNAAGRDLLPHEFNHSWNGKYRRGADLATPTFNVPMQDSLLWVYEGQTQFWGHVMAARSGLWSLDQALEMLAHVAATYDKGRPGMKWRTIQDTTNDPVIAQRRPLPFRNYQMSEDYYSGGQMIWLEVDGKLRELSQNKRSMDDFARAFFGIENGKWDVNPYTFEDVVKTLNEVTPHDWTAFLRGRLDGHGSLVAGIAASGWRLVYKDQPSAMTKGVEARRGFSDFTYSLGFSVNKEGTLGDVLWEGPAFMAGLAPCMKLVAVNGRDFSAEALRQAITAAAEDKSKPVELRVKNFNEDRTLLINYHEGLKYPHLERDSSKPDYLGELLKAR